MYAVSTQLSKGKEGNIISALKICLLGNNTGISETKILNQVN